jgi:flavin-dependent dehydrogenase
VSACRPTTIIGAGPAGLAAALALAGRGQVQIVAPNLPQSGDPARIDAVPAPLLALLLELGVHPTQLDVRELHDMRISAWGTARPEVARGHAVAHVKRPALELALLSAVARAPNIRVTDRVLAEPGRVIDATGRRAASARLVLRPPEPWLARVFWAEGRFDPRAQAFRIAALLEGYAYRLGTAARVMLGVVAPKSAEPPTEEWLRAAGAGWLLAGLPSLCDMRPGRGGVASVQWAERGGGAELAGDAALARDSLSSQGLAAGIADAVALARGLTEPGRQALQRERHLRSLAGLIASSRFAAAPAWSDYGTFLAAHGARASIQPRSPAMLRKASAKPGTARAACTTRPALPRPDTATSQ